MYEINSFKKKKKKEEEEYEFYPNHNYRKLPNMIIASLNSSLISESPSTFDLNLRTKKGKTISCMKKKKKKTVYNFVHLHCYTKMHANSDAKVVDARSH